MNCAECNYTPVHWISTSIGVTVCEDCAAVHQQLSWAISKLKSIQLDEFSEWQVNLLQTELGNSVANQIWEKSVPEGWSKPVPTSSVEDKAQWILAKYRWYGFVDEFRVRSDAQLESGIMEAVKAGNLKDVIWWISHKADINCTHPPGTGRTLLHEAITHEHVNVVAFLLQNGADLYAVDSSGNRPLDITVNSGKQRMIASMILQIQKGDY